MAGMKMGGGSSAMKNGKASFHVQNAGKTLKRLMGYFGKYKARFTLVVILIIFTSLCNVVATYMLKPVLNVFETYTAEPDYVIKGLEKIFYVLFGNGGGIYHNMPYFWSLIIVMGAVYLFGVSCNFLYNRLMLKISTGILNQLRKDMFNHMEGFPIRYFDSRTHGEIMSSYTNDTDLLREMISSSIPTFITSICNIIGFTVAMITLNWVLMLVCVVQIVANVLIVKYIGGKSRKNFVAQQLEVSKINGYVEEMMGGQKVVKVFNHEDQTNAGFDQINNKLASVAYKAQAFSNCLGPIMGNVAHIFYAITVTVGAAMVFGGFNVYGAPFLAAALVAFLEYSRRFSQPISQIGQNMNTIIAATAGAERIFALIDEPCEVDDGYVTLVNAVIDDDGTIHESAERTGRWAWKHPHYDGTLTYKEVRGDVRFDDVTFGYDENKTVLKNVSLFAKPGQKIAFVGSTGAGKTTITNLINRFYDLPIVGTLPQILDKIDTRQNGKTGPSQMGVIEAIYHMFKNDVEVGVYEDYAKHNSLADFTDMMFAQKFDQLLVKAAEQNGTSPDVIKSDEAYAEVVLDEMAKGLYEYLRIGKITYDGISIDKIKKDDLRRSLAMVLQDTHLFTGTVMENIRYGRLDATDEECIEAARLANADFFISHLPDGYNTLLTADGSNLSQGQRQLISIARAAVADPPVLILDEATSSIDTRTESLIEKGMDALMSGRTTFVIAHRLSTVRNSNAIMVLEHGRIIERGDHDDLLAQRGKYYQLYTGMFELD